MEQVPEDWQRGLVIVAHPDDIEYGAAAAVARWTGQGKDIRYVLVTSGEAGIAGMPPAEAGPLRQAEEIASAKVVGVEQVEFLGYPDGRVQESLELRRDLAAAIRRHRPEMLVLFNFGDTWAPGYANSADHRAVGRAGLDAASDAGNEWIFPELSDLPPWSPRWAAVVGPVATHAVDVTATVEQAAASLAEHRRYLEVLSSEPVADQVAAIVDMATGPKDGFPAERAVGFELYYFG
ncbi:N-acetylglucosaminyl deacetylase, LmbE family [Nocardia amikacinitolerans]|uniref:N-acetylglucosaminyl deacetylase, LmbE family n=1 Tax=Nocardia amikacinitolerans TaxID=756689 RepID=A0A285LZQ8_9NOCA|nr:PIG-L deacetylase family protein [Nocardia amikacinitolerans]MCP2280099.1 N-acetylglucosaminyl deacetylase, LmbE family [Nocardia amikacinitolerans]MCP2299913.1 N-acetylglucosaminyl deacetylase, LmbE family [Nocardia amikacinitolerans]SNY88771.1 N-acetylglucosaminyl deacetylase, LmbE family [Nocardia amikacinitolerans]